ncbi:MAG: AlpA family phage regulatory protein [Gammaproteobacteria bacterium]|nr:AlpA family phage regulatory protein [Gammaproteobacteria bacterium]
MDNQKHEALLRRHDVEKRTGISRSQLFELIRRGEFPKPIPLVGRTRAWVESDISAWIASRIEAARLVGNSR